MASHTLPSLDTTSGKVLPLQVELDLDTAWVK